MSTGEDLVSGLPLLREAVQRVYQRALSSRRVIEKQWLVQSFLREELEPFRGPDADLLRACVYCALSDLFGRIIRRDKADEPDEAEAVRGAQMVLPGLNLIQARYSTVRDGKVCSVPHDEMTDEELLRKADELEALSLGAKKHAQQLRRYVEVRAKALADAGKVVADIVTEQGQK